VPVMLNIKSVGHFCYQPPIRSAYLSIGRSTKKLIVAQ
jgi:hypothetical protein